MNGSPARFQLAAEALRNSPIPALRHVRVEDMGETVILSGQVPSYYHKQLAQETVMPVIIGGRLENRLAVVHDDFVAATG